MKRAPRTIAAAVLLGSLSAIPFVGSATAAAKAPKTVTVSASKSTLTAPGGSVTIRATVKSAKTCTWSVRPKVKGFDESAKSAAKLSRVAKLPANTTKSTKRFTFSLNTASGKVKASASVVVSEKGKPVKLTATAPTTISTTVPPSTGTTSTTTTTTAPAPVIALGVSLDPTFTQNPSNPFEVTYTFNASATVNGQPSAPGQLPSGVLDFFNDGLLASSLNVGGSVTGGTVTITYGAFGTHSVVTEYVSGTNSATTGAQPEDIEPPPVAPATVAEVWGGGANATVYVIGSSASVSISDANFEGATSVGVTDQLGDSCTATVSGTAATCTMSVTGTPSSLTVNYPGGTSVVTTQTVSPWGVPQSQQVTDTWPSESVPISGSHLAVTVQAATVVWNGGSVLNGSVSARTWSGDPANPINITSGQSVRLGAYASGSLGSDTIGLGGIAYTVSPSGSYSLTDEQPASSSVNCSDSSDYVGDAVGECQVTFTGTGTFTISTSYVSTDPNYASVQGPSVTVDVS